MDLALGERRALLVGPDDELRAACAATLAAEGCALVEGVGDGPDIVIAHGERGSRSIVDCDSADAFEAMWNPVETTLGLYREALGAMQARGWGRLVWIGSAASRSLDADGDQLDA
ncbi:hypothetical protein, partial [Bradyrhizobium sp. NBAIM08]|uniref:hypothetical protein n=1 Tax=Bradyrhizobium sp. NBAIM08 TaxID=2793815 RepID=UPI001CD3C74B